MHTVEAGSPAATRRTSGHRSGRALLGVGLLLAVVVAACASTETVSSPPDASGSTTGSGSLGTTVGFDDHLVDVNGHQVAVSCHGSGPKTVLFLGDVGQTGDVGWGQSGVPASVAGGAVACTFDRPGLGHSEAGNEPRSLDNQVKDLDGLVRGANLTTPLVLVGQGYGTFIARQFAKDHRDSVSGLVLIDPPLWLYEIKVPTDASAGVMAEYGSLVQLDKDLGSYGAGALPPPPAPTVVIGVDPSLPDLPPTPAAGTSLEGVAPITTIQPLPDPSTRNDDQRQLAQKSPFGKYQQLDGAGAYAQYWKPDAVTATIMTIVNAKPGK